MEGARGGDRGEGDHMQYISDSRNLPPECEPESNTLQHTWYQVGEDKQMILMKKFSAILLYRIYSMFADVQQVKLIPSFCENRIKNYILKRYILNTPAVYATQ